MSRAPDILPSIALWSTDSPLHTVDIAIPCSNSGAPSGGPKWRTLAWEVLRMRGTVSWVRPRAVVSYFTEMLTRLQRRTGQRWKGRDQGGISGRTAPAPD